MRLYPKGAPRHVVDHPKWGHFEAAGDGGFDFPDEMSDELHSFHHRGKPLWENDDERSVRLHTDDLERRRDPAALYDAVDNFTGLLGKLAAVQVPAAAAPDGAAQAEIAELKRQLAELQASLSPAPADGDSGEDGDPEPGETGAKATGRRTVKTA